MKGGIIVEDDKIVDLLFKRDESAVGEMTSKYHKYCYTIAHGILHSDEDAKEAVNDTWIGAWNSIPPNKPERLSTYLGKITRRISLNMWRNSHTAKRKNNQIDMMLDELADSIPSGKSIEDEMENRELGKLINEFLNTIPDIEQKVFVCRYWYADSIAKISEDFGFTQSKVKSMLHRTRKKLRVWLEKEGVFI